MGYSTNPNDAARVLVPLPDSAKQASADVPAGMRTPEGTPVPANVFAIERRLADLEHEVKVHVDAGAYMTTRHQSEMGTLWATVKALGLDLKDIKSATKDLPDQIKSLQHEAARETRETGSSLESVKSTIRALRRDFDEYTRQAGAYRLPSGLPDSDAVRVRDALANIDKTRQDIKQVEASVRARLDQFENTQGWHTKRICELADKVNDLGLSMPDLARAVMGEIEPRMADLEAGLSAFRGQFAIVAGFQDKIESRVADLEGLGPEPDEHDVQTSCEPITPGLSGPLKPGEWVGLPTGERAILVGPGPAMQVTVPTGPIGPLGPGTEARITGVQIQDTWLVAVQPGRRWLAPLERPAWENRVVPAAMLVREEPETGEMLAYRVALWVSIGLAALAFVMLVISMLRFVPA